MKKLLMIIILFIGLVITTCVQLYAQSTTYYRTMNFFAQTSMWLPSDGATISVILPQGTGPLIVNNQVWTYRERDMFVNGGPIWVNGNDYAQLSADKTQIMFVQRIIISNMPIPSEMVIFLAQDIGLQGRQNMAITLNQQIGSNTAVSNMYNNVGTYNNTYNNSNMYNNNSPTLVTCPRCHGDGEFIKWGTVPTYGYDSEKWCQKCKKYFMASSGHHHVTCQKCHGTGKIKQ